MSCSGPATWRGLRSGVRSWRARGAEAAAPGRGVRQLTAANAPETARRLPLQPGLVSRFQIQVPLTRNPSHADILGMPDRSKRHERLTGEGVDPLVVRAIERWENEGGAVKPPSKLERPRDPNQLGKLGVDMAPGEAPPGA